MKKIFNKNFVSIFIVAFLLYLCLNMTQPILPRYLKSLNVATVTIGFISSLFALVALSLRPISGQVVDNENKKMVLIFAISLVLVSMVGYYFSNNYLMIGFFRGLHGFAWAFGSTVCMTIAINTLPTDKINEGIGYYGLGQIIAGAVAPTVGIFIADEFGYDALFLTTIIFAILSLILCFNIKFDIKSIRKRYELKISKIIAKKAILPSLLTLCNMIIYGALTTFIIIYGESMNISNASLFFSIYSATILASRIFITKLSNKIGSKKMILICESMIVAGMGVVFLANSLIMFILSGLLVGFGFSGCQPLLMSESVKSVSLDSRGVASSTNYIGTDIGMVIGCYGSSYLVEYFGYRIMFLFVVIPLIFAIIFYNWRKINEV